MLQLPKMDLFLTENRGWGVKAAAPIPRGAFIVEYAGALLYPVALLANPPNALARMSFPGQLVQFRFLWCHRGIDVKEVVWPVLLHILKSAKTVPQVFTVV